MPLDITLERMALEKAINIRGNYKCSWSTTIMTGRTAKQASFRYKLDLLANKYNIELDVSDKCKSKMPYCNFYREPLPHAYIIIYTDGSKMDSKVGYGFTCQGEIDWEGKGSLRGKATVFQAEMQAILAICLELEKEKISGQVINFFSNSQAAITSLFTVHMKSKLVSQTKKKLNIIGKFNLISLSWVKAHVGIEGNERADNLAKEG